MPLHFVFIDREKYLVFAMQKPQGYFPAESFNKMPVKSKGGNHVALHNKGGNVLDEKQNEQPKDKFGMTTPAGLK